MDANKVGAQEGEQHILVQRTAFRSLLETPDLRPPAHIPHWLGRRFPATFSRTNLHSLCLVGRINIAKEVEVKELSKGTQGKARAPNPGSSGDRSGVLGIPEGQAELQSAVNEARPATDSHFQLTKAFRCLCLL